MKWNIEGADRDDGSDITLVIEAKTKADAVARANARGVLVSAARPVAAPVEYERSAPEPAPAPSAGDRVPCPSCAEMVSANATLCPFCKQPIFSKNKGANALIALVSFVVLFFVLFYAISAFVNHEADKDFRRIMDQSQRETDQIMRQAERDADEMMRRLNR